MPTHMNIRWMELLELWPYIERFNDLANAYGIPDVFQDAGGKMLQLAIATGLDLNPSRQGPDAHDRTGGVYEIKTTDVSRTNKGFSTNHHLTVRTLAGYRSCRWVFATYESITLMEARLLEPEELEPVFLKWEQRLNAMPNSSGNHLNNPKIPLDYVQNMGRTMYMKDVIPPWVKL